MAGYVIAQIDVTDGETFAKYRDLVAPTIAKHGGRYLVRGGEVTSLEETPPTSRVVVIEFESVEAAKTWYTSDDYAPLIKLRQSASNGPVSIVEGI
jgi:uncharacterized protein (DUF1330 family)